MKDFNGFMVAYDNGKIEELALIEMEDIEAPIRSDEPFARQILKALGLDFECVGREK